MPSSRTSNRLPPTVNLHWVAICNMKCRYCYARFIDSRRTRHLPIHDALQILRELSQAHVRRVTFAGGEPTLHPDLEAMLEAASHLGMVTAIVSNGSRIDAEWLVQHGPHLRWLTLSIDSIDAATARRLGRHAGPDGYQHPEQVLQVAKLVHRWNELRPADRRIRLKLNITVTRVNQHEDPRPFLTAMRPEKVKLLQMLRVAGENDDAADLTCDDAAFQAYAARVANTPLDGLAVVVEDQELMDGSYAMVDPEGRFYQRVEGRYLRSQPIHRVGVAAAWNSVGGFDAERFAKRGGEYEPGEVARGNAPFWIAVEGLDGSGKSTIVAALAKRLGAAIVSNPPRSMAQERNHADALPPAERRAWYLKANFVAAAEAAAHRAQGSPVVMDRSVASTLAFAAAEARQPVAAWPVGLQRPDLLVLLRVEESERMRRLGQRGGSHTEEELRLAADHEFRHRVLEAYQDLGATPVDALGAPEQIVDQILKLAASAPSPRQVHPGHRGNNLQGLALSEGES